MILYISCQRDSNTNGLVKPLIEFQISSFKVLLKKEVNEKLHYKVQDQIGKSQRRAGRNFQKDFEKKMKKGVDKRNAK